ncbi:putative ribonuclease H-like domain-containing protein, partial [Tanacetum coccineum]
MKPTEVDERGDSDKNEKDAQDTRSESEKLNQREMQTEHTNSTNSINTVSTPISTAGPSFDNIAGTIDKEVDMNNVDTSYTASDAPFTKFLKDHPQEQVIGSLKTPVQTRHMTKINEEHGLISSVHKLRRTNHKDFQNCLFACFLSQKEPKKVIQALEDPSWVEAMQDELLQFKLLKVWTLVDLPRDKWAIGTKWVFRNKKDERGIVVKNKARLVAQGYTQEEGIDYDEVFAPVARIEAIRLFLAYASFKGFVVYQMDVKSDFLYGKIEEEIYVCQPPIFEDPNFPDKVYKVEKALYGLHQAPRACTPIETNKALVKDEVAEAVDVHLYRSMIGSLMYLTASRPGIMFVVCACARFQVTPKTSHLHAVKRIFRYLKCQSKLGLLYPKDSPFDLEAFSDSNYAGASLDMKSTTGEYVAAANCCRQNPVFHSKTKRIEIRHHFIRDSYEKRLIQVIKIYTDYNVADLLTKAFDAKNIKYLVGDEAIHKKLGDRMERAATTASSLEVEQDIDAQTSIEVYTAMHILMLLGEVNTARPKVSTVRLKLVLLGNR